MLVTGRLLTSRLSLQRASSGPASVVLSICARASLGSGLGFGIHPQRKLLSWCARDGRWLLHTRPGEKIGESKEGRRKGVLGRRAETIASGSWRREEDLREERVCGEVPLTCVLGGLPIFLLGDKQVTSNVESQPVFYLALTQKKGSVSFGLPLSGCRERDQLVPDLTV